jgi:hypothetical protein
MGSLSVTPNNNEDMTRVNAKAPANPKTIPIDARIIPCRTTWFNTLSGRAPSARRSEYEAVIGFAYGTSQSHF